MLFEQDPPQLGAHASGERRLAAATLWRALLDMRDGDLEACAWLASTAASTYFDAAGFEQSGILAHSDWLSHAHHHLARQMGPTEYLSVLSSTLQALEPEILL